MDSTKIVTRIARLEEDDMVGNPQFTKTKMILDFNKLGDYEEYKGDVWDGKSKMCLILHENSHVSEYKIIIYDFEKLHKEYEEWKKSIEYREGKIKLN